MGDRQRPMVYTGIENRKCPYCGGYLKERSLSTPNRVFYCDSAEHGGKVLEWTEKHIPHRFYPSGKGR